MTLLDNVLRRQLLRAWSDVSHALGGTTPLCKPVPHFTYHGAEGYQEAGLEQLLRACASENPVFTVEAKGIASFPGPDRVVYIPVRLSEELSSLHEALWSGMGHLAKAADDYYRPGRWVPHITIAQADRTRGPPLTQEAVDESVSLLTGYDFNWEVLVNNLTVVRTQGTRLVVTRRFRLSGRS